MTTEKAQHLEDIQQFVRLQPRVVVQAGDTKRPLHADANLDLSDWAGVVEYEPTEYTFTARSGTRLAAVRDLLAAHHQFLPFDPILIERGATLGGTVASGCSGAGRFRFGGVRDFLLGVQLVNGDGDLVRGGGKVVKNAAGFDIPKLMVGALGRFGVMVEMTFKVFPRPESSVTLDVTAADLPQSLRNLSRVSLSPAEVSCLDLLPPNRLLVRISGWHDASADHLLRVQQLVEGTMAIHHGDEDEAIWREAREFPWIPSGFSLVRVPLLPSQIPECEERISRTPAGPRRYSIGGNLLWLAWPGQDSWSELDDLLSSLGRPGQVVLGESPLPIRGPRRPQVFSRRLITVFDPKQKFGADRFPE